MTGRAHLGGVVVQVTPDVSKHAGLGGPWLCTKGTQGCWSASGLGILPTCDRGLSRKGWVARDSLTHSEPHLLWGSFPVCMEIHGHCEGRARRTVRPWLAPSPAIQKGRRGPI